MNRPTPESLGKSITRVATEFPAGAIVWHKADRRKGIVEEYAIDGQGCVMVCVNWGAGMNWEKCSIMTLSATKPDNEETGDGWLQSGGAT